MNRTVYFFVAIVALIVDTGSCIKCYNCMSQNNKECLDPSAHPQVEPQECNMNLLNQLAEEARKVSQQLGNAFGIDIHSTKNDLSIPIVCQKIETTVGKEKVVVRGCQVGNAGDVKFCENIKSQMKDSVITHCSLCETDGCNSGTFLTPFSFLSLLLPILGIKLWTVFGS